MIPALQISRPFRQNDRNWSMNLEIVSPTSAADAVSGTPAIASLAVGENSIFWGQIDEGKKLDREDLAGIARMPRHVRRSTIFGASRQHGSRAIDDRPSRKQGRRAGSTKSRVLPSNPAGRMRGRAGAFPGSQVDKRRRRPSSRDNLLDWTYPRPRVNLRGNHALS